MVAGLAFLLTLPLVLVGCVAADRDFFHKSAMEDISHSWGERQRIAGPVMVIPAPAGDADGTVERQVLIMPDTVDLKANMQHEMRRRGIFSTPVLHIDIDGTGTFSPLDLEDLQTKFGSLRLDLAWLAIAVEDTRGIRAAEVQWAGRSLGLSATAGGGAVSPGIRGELGALAVQDGGAFAFSLKLRGTERFSAVPVGAQSTFTVQSSWPHPSFDGRFLPDTHDITDEGFTASWSISGLARGFPQTLRLNESDASPFSRKEVGFSVFEPVNLYSLMKRSIKYGVLFIALTLVSLLCLELAIGVRFHLVQYAVVGIALVTFFLTLLGLAEHIGFAGGYAIAAALLTFMIGWYAHRTTARPRLAAIAVGALALLYTVLYILLHLESYALLLGSALLLATLAMLMRTTSSLSPSAKVQPRPPRNDG